MFHSIIYVNNQLLFNFTTQRCHGFLSSWVKVNEKRGWRGEGENIHDSASVFSKTENEKTVCGEERNVSHSR